MIFSLSSLGGIRLFSRFHFIYSPSFQESYALSITKYVAVCTLFFFVSTSLSVAKDIVIVNVGESQNDQRIEFKNELVKMALEITKEQFGEYEIVENTQRMNISRAFRELEKGDSLSLTFAHTRAEFEQRALTVRVPLRQGLDSYRLLMVKKGNENKFANVETLEDLKRFTVGLSPNWSTYTIMQQHQFTIVDAEDYSTMFKMLESERFDFVPRALNEVYNELMLYQPMSEGLAVVPNLALYIPSASYMFVSKKQPRIYQRLNTGLHAMVVNGDLLRLTEKYYQRFVKRAAMQNRKVIAITHSLLPVFIPQPPLAPLNCDCNQVPAS